MAVARGIFGLYEVVEEKFNNTWTDLAQVWIDQIPNTGYFGGGSPVRSIMDKVTYASDAISQVPTAKLNVARYSLAATGNSTAGYFGGGTGISPIIPAVSVMEKITYSTDIVEVITSGGLPVPYSTGLSATGNASAGYFGGGTPGTTSVGLTVMYKLSYANDTSFAIPSAYFPFPNGVSAQGATGNSTAGYFGGGGYSYMWKLSYSTENTVYTSTANLSSACNSLAATGNASAGYFGGGSFIGTRSTMDKTTYSSDTTAAVPGASLSVARERLAATGNSTAGYFGGGAAPGNRSTMDKVTYSSDTTAAVPGAFLSVARNDLAASSAKANALTQNNWRRFSDGSTTTNPASLPPATPTPQTAIGPTLNTGYFGGGGVAATPIQSLSTMNKIDYSSDTTAAVPGASLSAVRYNLAATGNSTHGYFGGGANQSIPASFSSMDKLSYLIDTRIAVPSANLGIPLSRLAATGSSTAGYFGGGIPGTNAMVYKLVYSNDTTSQSPNSSLSAARYSFAATGNSTAGYFGTGNPGQKTSMDKLNYSTNITAAVPTANLGLGREGIAATGNASAGYFGGGSFSGTRSTVDKITYATDSRQTIPTASLITARTECTATGNSSDGYFAGGINFPSYYSLMDKVTYSTDTTSAAPSNANLSSVARGSGSSSARANALPLTGPGPVFV